MIRNKKNKDKVKYRTKFLRKYIAGRDHEVSEVEIQAFQSGFNMAWKFRNNTKYNFEEVK